MDYQNQCSIQVRFVLMYLLLSFYILSTNAQPKPRHVDPPKIPDFLLPKQPTIHSFASLSTVYASPDGSMDSNSCGSIDSPCNLVVATNITSNNGQIILLDGIYTGVCNLISIKVSTTITAQHIGNAVIDCEQNGRAFVCMSGTRVSISGITIQNGVTESGSAIASASLLYVDSCTFINNTASSQSGSSYAGAIMQYGTATITNSVFLNNSAISPTATGVGFAGSIYLGAQNSPNTALSLINCTFIGNSVIGGVGETPYEASECGYGAGGAITVTVTMDFSNLNVQGCTFRDNFVKGGDCLNGLITGEASAGALQMAIFSSNFSANIDFTEFSGNSATAGSYGNIGAYAFAGAATFGVTGTSQYQGNVLTITNSVFHGNSVHGAQSYLSLLTYGGGVVISDAATATIHNTTFTNNTAQAGYGSVSSGPAAAGGLILQNTAKDFELVISDSIFSDNIAQAGNSDAGSPGDANGGALVISGAAACNLHLLNVEFTRNFAYGGTTSIKSVGGGAYSGAIYYSGTPANSVVTVENCQFDHNSAVGGTGVLGGIGEGGAALFGNAAHVDISNCTFTNNTALGGSGSPVVNTAYGGQAFGGAVCLDNAPTWITDSFFSGNAAKGGKGASSQTSWDLQGQDGGSGGNAYGGSIYSTQGSPGRSGKAFGGAVGADNLIVTNTMFQHNLAGDNFAETAQSSGGAIGAGKSLEISDATFLNNQATASSQAFGGAVLSASSTTIQNVSFEFNSVQLEEGQGYGGAIYAPPLVANESYIGISSIKMYNNTVTGLGGAIFINNTEEVVIKNGDMSNNTAQYGGGIYLFSEENQFQYNQSVNMQSITFMDNSATFGGGAMFVSYDTLVQINTTEFTFENNTALYGSTTASDVITLSFSVAPPTSVWPGEIFPMELVLLDGLNNTVITPSLSVTVSADSTAFVSGIAEDTSLIDMVTGAFLFATSTIVSNTGSVCHLFFTSISPSSLDEVSQFNASKTLYVTGCPPSTYLTVSSFGFTCSQCQPGEYNLDGEKCLSCPQPTGTDQQDDSVCVDLNVRSRQLTVMEGYYPHPSFTNPSELLACPYSKACKQFSCDVVASESILEVACDQNIKSSSETNNTCADGYEDRLCSKCICNSDECYYQTSENSCLQCEASHRDQWIENQFYLVNGVLALGVTYMLVTKAIPSALIRGLWFYAQSTLILLVPEAWPTWMYKLDRYLPFIGSMQIYSTQCLLPHSWSHPIPQFLIVMVSPFLLTVAALVGFLVLKFFRWIDKKFDLRKKVLTKVTCVTCLLPQKPSSHHHQKSIGYLAVRSFLLVLNLIYFSLAASILTILQPCDSHNYMPQYPWISCDSSDYHSLISLATAFALFYILGVPVLFGILLWARRDQIRATKMRTESIYKTNQTANEDYDDYNSKEDASMVAQPLLDTYGPTTIISAPTAHNLKLIEFLYQSYTIQAYWFEIVWITRKLMIAVAIQLIPSTLGQVTCVTFALAAGIALQNWLQPYENQYKYINTMEIISSGVIALTLNIGYHIKELGSGTTKEFVQSIMVIMNAMLVAGIVAVMAFQLVQFRKGKRQRTLANASFRWMMAE